KENVDVDLGSTDCLSSDPNVFHKEDWGCFEG
ncbi:hypothetical protein Gohar_024766, partial [Gossypium harknessii]|nr:hypothetical protein [Gossypium harknessii]